MTTKDRKLKRLIETVCRKHHKICMIRAGLLSISEKERAEKEHQEAEWELLDYIDKKK